MSDGIIKDANYFATSIISIATAFATWRVARFTYHIYQKKKDISLLENT